MVLEQTLIVVKPDGFQRALTGKILARFEEKGFEIKNLKSYNFTKEKPPPRRRRRPVSRRARETGGTHVEAAKAPVPRWLEPPAKSAASRPRA